MIGSGARAGGERAGAIVVGAHANALGAVRSLGSRGIPVEVVITGPSGFAHLSKYARGHVRLPNFFSDVDALAALLEDNRDRWRGWMVLPTNDHALTALSRHRELLERWYAPSVPPLQQVRRLLDKGESRRTAESLGIPVPRLFGRARSGTLPVGPMTYPVLVKPLASHLFFQRFKKKLFVVRDEDELRRAVDQVDGEGLEAEVQDCIPGSDDQVVQYVVYVDGKGDVVAEAAYRKLRQAPPGFGVACAAELVDAPELREPTVAFLRDIGWRGIAAAEFKRDARDGQFKLIEVNGRCFLAHRLLREAGVDLPFLAWSDAVEGAPAPSTSQAWEGVWQHLYADARYALHRLNGSPGRLLSGLRSYASRPRTYAVWSRSDPRPFLAQWDFISRRTRALRMSFAPAANSDAPAADSDVPPNPIAE